MSTTSEFFDVQSAGSQVKSEIVSKYVDGWARIMLQYLQTRQVDPYVIYVDLFSGQGYYDDGSASTPIHLLQKAIALPLLQNGLRTYFNDGNLKHTQRLKENVAALPDIQLLKYYPEYNTDKINESLIEFVKIAGSRAPTLTFADPWGYKGLTKSLFKAALAGFGCEIILFFNYDRINRSITVSEFKENFDLLFGTEVTAKLIVAVKGLDAPQRESLILETFDEVLKSCGAKHISRYYFRKGRRASHMLIHATTHSKGYALMRRIRKQYSGIVIEGVPNYTFNYKTAGQGVLEFDTTPINLAQEILDTFAKIEMEMSAKMLYEVYGGDESEYELSEFKQALLALESKGKLVITRPPSAKASKNTLSDIALINFSTTSVNNINN